MKATVVVPVNMFTRFMMWTRPGEEYQIIYDEKNNRIEMYDLSNPSDITFFGLELER